MPKGRRGVILTTMEGPCSNLFFLTMVIQGVVQRHMTWLDVNKTYDVQSVQACKEAKYQQDVQCTISASL